MNIPQFTHSSIDGLSDCLPMFFSRTQSVIANILLQASQYMQRASPGHMLRNMLLLGLKTVHAFDPITQGQRQEELYESKASGFT